MWCALITLAATTGMRFGATQALRWEDVDVEEGTVEVKNPSHHRAKSGKNAPFLPQTAQVQNELDRNGPFVFHTYSSRPSLYQHQPEVLHPDDAGPTSVGAA